MKEKKNIDRLFQEQFKDFEAKPSKKVWAGIEASLKENNKRKPFIVPLWYKVAGVAAVLAIMFLAGSLLMTNKNNSDAVVETGTEVNKPETDNNVDASEKTLTEAQDNSTFNNTEASDSTEKDITASENTVNGTSNAVTETSDDLQLQDEGLSQPNSNSSKSEIATNKQNSTETPLTEDAVANSSNQNKNSTESENTVQNQNTTENTAVANTETSGTNTKSDASEDKTNAAVVEGNKKSLLEEAQKKNQESFTEETVTEGLASSKKWEVSPYAAPIYYSGFGNGSAIDPQFSDNDADGEVSLAYGVNFSYALNERLKVRSGVTKVTHSFNTNDIAFSPTTDPSAIRSISQNGNNGLNIAIRDSNISRGSGVPQLGIPGGSDIFGRTALPQLFEGSLNQTLGYIEVPVELEYALVNNRFGVNIFGGASTLFLDENRVSVVTAGNTNEIGEANNVNTVSFSTNLGFGFNYKITNSFKINLEPTFKYQVNTFSNSSNFNPYYLGLYSGFSFKF